MRLLLTTFIIFINLTNFVLSQEKYSHASFAEAYGAVRYFFPNSISDVDWRMFNYRHINSGNIEAEMTVNDFTEIFSEVSKKIEFSENDFSDLKPYELSTPAYWQYYGFGKKNGTYYKSALVPKDSIDYLYNGLVYFDRIQGNFDSVDVKLDIEQSDTSKFSNIFLLYGWKSGKQIISQEYIQYNAKEDIYYCRFKESFTDVYFRYFLESQYGINLKIKSLSIIGYKNGKDSIFLHQNFSLPLNNKIDLGSHHSTNINIDNLGFLNITTNEQVTFYQVFEENIKEKNQYFKAKLSNGLYMRFPIVVDENQISDTIINTNYEFSRENYSVIAKCNLIDCYGHLLHFHPYFNAGTSEFSELFSNLFELSDSCTSISSIHALVSKLLYPVKDSHMYIYNYRIPTPKKYLGISIEFIDQKCYVKNSKLKQFKPGDRIIDFQGVDPWVLYQKKCSLQLGSDNYAEFRAKNVIFIEDTTKQININYRRGLKKLNFKGYASYNTNVHLNQYNNIHEIKNDIYYVDLNNIEKDIFLNFIDTTPNLQGLILDGREGIKVESEILTSISKDTMFYPLVFLPKYLQPFQTEIEFDTLNKNEFILGNSEVKIPLVLMISSKNLSSEETFVHLAKQIPHLILAGEESAGCNGMVAHFRSSGAFEYRFTGSIVKKINGETLYNNGYETSLKPKLRKRDLKKQNDRLLMESIKYLEKDAKFKLN